MSLNLPTGIASIIQLFSRLFSTRVWKQAQVLMVGSILATRKRTVSSILEVMGMANEKNFQNYHRVLSRAAWSNLEASRILLMVVISIFAASGPIIMGIDDTIERRKGKKIKAKGIYRDPVRSSHSQFVKVSGLRWLAVMLLVEIPWAGRVWALPFFTVLAPSERYNQQHKRRHKTLIDWGRQMILQIRRWLPKRELVMVADSSFAALELLFCVSQQKLPIQMITRLRLDAALYEPAPKRQANTMGRPALKGARMPNLKQRLVDPNTHWQTVIVNNWYGQGKREVEICSDTAVWYHTGMRVVPIRWVLIRDPKGKFETQALLCTYQDYSPIQILEWFVRRWQVEVTFEEVRAHLGVETQRQWSDKAIARTTPLLFGLFSLVTVLAHHLQTDFQWQVRQTSWYSKHLPSFSDALALVRRFLWASTFSMSHESFEMVKVPRPLFERLRDIAVYAA